MEGEGRGGGGGEYEQVSTLDIRQIFSLSTSPSHVPLHNKCEVLELDEQANNDEDKDQARLVGSPRASQPTPCITITSIKKQRRVTVTDYLLRGTEGLVC